MAPDTLSLTNRIELHLEGGLDSCNDVAAMLHGVQALLEQITEALQADDNEDLQAAFALIGQARDKVLQMGEQIDHVQIELHRPATSDACAAEVRN